MRFGLLYEHQLPRPWIADSAGGLTQHQHAAVTVPLEDPLSPR